MDKLKPCPCCGGERVDTLKGNWMESDKPFWKVWCKSCQLRTWCEPTRKGAIAVWNARTVDTELAAAKARIAELERQAELYRDLHEDATKAAKTYHDRMAELEKALEPFAREEVESMYKDPWHLQFSDPDGFVDFTDFTIGDLRRAAALLKEKE